LDKIENIVRAERERIENALSVFQDPNFVFESESHTYTYGGIKYDSVTTFLKEFKEPFDKEYWAARKAAERGVSPEEIKKEWADKGKTATDLGTDIHSWIEEFWKGKNPDPPDLPESRERCERFLEVYESKLKKFIPLKPELKVFSRKWRLAGTIDQPLLFWDSKASKVLFVLGDWKTNKEFRDDDHSKGRFKKMLRPFSYLYENHHNEYSIQISLYRLILEDEIGIETHDGFLCHIGPEGPAKIYRAKDLREPLRVYLDHNRSDEFDIFSI